MTPRAPAGLQNLSSYQPAWLRNDVVAGLVLTALLVPQGMAYAELAGLPPITGLYTSIMCLVAYAVFGPSKILVLGPDSSLGPMIAATIIPLVAVGDEPATTRSRPGLSAPRSPCSSARSSPPPASPAWASSPT